MWTEKLTAYCLHNNIIAEKDIPWFKYGVEKRITTLVGGIPVFILAVLISEPYTAIAFYISFYLLRTRMNGYHASGLWSCLLLSLLHVAVFLGIFSYLLDANWALIIALGCTVIIWLFAPFDHPNMHYTQEEYLACRKSSRARSAGMLVCAVLFYLTDFEMLLIGLSLGNAMATYLLCLAYIQKWRLEK